MADHQKLHKMQEDHMSNDVGDESRQVVHDSWFNESTVDYWRHKRMYETIEPLARLYKNGKWLTVGDGRYGLDSNRLSQLFGLDVLPTDISGKALKKAQEKGHISSYSVENVEDLSFADNSFDVVFCKETFHHCPRPILGLYEMLRVARKAVVLIEPNDINVLVQPKIFIKKVVRKILNNLVRSDEHPHDMSFFKNYGNMYEDSGNYVYAVSRREIEKIVQGANLHGVAWLGLNDHYIKGCEFAEASQDNEIFRNLRKAIDEKNKKCRNNPLFYDYGLLSMVIFKDSVDEDLQAEMEAMGFQFSNVRRNPHQD
jgi:ubiquinone/menaquinone biosynthesis C-methylase UbiE